MIALRSSSTTRPGRRRKIYSRSLSAPQALLTKRISDLHRKLISPASDLETVKAAKQSLLRLLSDPMTLPVITTPPMEFAVLANAAPADRSHPGESTPVCELCQSPLPARSSARHKQSLTSINPFRGLRSKAMRTRPLPERRAIPQPSLATAHAFS